MEIDLEVGNIIIEHTDGSESHIFPPEPNNFDDDGEIREKCFQIVSNELGVFDEISEYSREEEKSSGVYSVAGKSYKSSKCKLDVIQDEMYFGASGGTEQIILAIFGGVAGGIATVISTKLFDLIADKTISVYSDSIPARSLDKKQRIIEKILIKRFHAKSPIQYLKVKHGKNVTECEIEDSHKKKYFAQIKERGGVLHFDIQQVSKKLGGPEVDD
jgi:hypothetical protein